MKKIVVLNALLSFVAQAESAVTSSQEAMEGFYAGLGICYNHSVSNIKAMEAYPDAFPDMPIWYGQTIQCKKNDTMGASVVIGYGRFVDNVLYLGGEVMLDVADSKASEDRNLLSNAIVHTFENQYYAKINGVVPSIAFRIGKWCSSFNSVVYAKVGIALIRTEYQEKGEYYDHSVRKKRMFSPLIGLGVERKIFDKFNVRLEGDYRFQTKKEDYSYLEKSCKFRVENRQKGFTVRAIMTCKL